MADKERVIKAVFRAVEETNEQLSEDGRLKKDIDAVLLGPNSVLDSLGSAIFFSVVEANVQEEFKIAVTLLNERALSGSNNPFATLGRLIDYICLLLEKGSDDSFKEPGS